MAVGSRFLRITPERCLVGQTSITTRAGGPDPETSPAPRIGPVEAEPRIFTCLAPGGTGMFRLRPALTHRLWDPEPRHRAEMNYSHAILRLSAHASMMAMPDGDDTPCIGMQID